MTANVSEGMFKVDMQYSSTGEAGWTKVGNQANQLPKTQPKSLFFNLEQYK